MVFEFSHRALSGDSVVVRFFLAHCELRCERDLSVFLALVDTLCRPSSTGPMTWFALTHRHDASVSKSQLKNNHSALTLQARALTIKQATETDLSCLTRHVTGVRAQNDIWTDRCSC